MSARSARAARPLPNRAPAHARTSGPRPRRRPRLAPSPAARARRIRLNPHASPSRLPPTPHAALPARADPAPPRPRASPTPPVLLPHIIFEAGFSLPRDLFFTRIGAILAFAVGGTAIATLFTWLLIVACAQAGLILKLSTIEAGALAALISAIDPVSTLTLFKLLRVHPDLHNILFGESVLNDAVSIILFRSIQRFFVADFRPLTDTLLSLVAFGEVASGSIGIGLLVAFGAAGVLKLSRLGHTADSAIVESGVFWIFSYGSFLVAEAAGLSGIVSALFCGIAMQRYAAPNLSAEARVAVPLLLQTIASLAEATVFVLVGLATWVYVDQSNVWTLTLVTMVGCFGGRALNIFGISRFLNHRAKPEYRIPLNHQLVMWFSGLRGAIAVTLAVQVPGSHHDEIVMCTVVIVLFTTFVLGGLSEPLIARARIERGPEVIAAFHAERKRRKREARCARCGRAAWRTGGGSRSPPAVCDEPLRDARTAARSQPQTASPLPPCLAGRPSRTAPTF